MTDTVTEYQSAALADGEAEEIQRTAYEELRAEVLDSDHHPEEEQDPDAGAGAGRFVWADPFVLVVDPFNHRKKRSDGEDEDDTTEPNLELIASVEEFGVQTPLLLRPQPDGTLGIIFGQRRNKAAQLAAPARKAAGQPWKVPAIVRDDLADADDDALVLSVVENRHREDASTLDYIEAAQQLALMKGGTRTKRKRQARAMGLTEQELDAAAQASQLDDATLKRGVDRDFDLLELADLETVKEHPDAISELSTARYWDQRSGGADRGRWNHTLQKLRDELTERAKLAQLREQLREAGLTVLDWRSDWTQVAARPVAGLLGSLGKPLDAERHAQDCPGRAVAIDPSGEPVPLCADWKANRHQMPEAPKPVADNSELRQVKAYNAAWRSARTVRHDFIKQICARKGEASSEIWTQILSIISSGCAANTDMMAQFLSAEPKSGRDPRYGRQDPFGDLIARTGKQRRWTILFAQVAAHCERQYMHDGAWRNTIDRAVVQWIEFLAKHCGYTLSEIEEETLETARQQAAEVAAKEAARAAAQAKDDEAELELDGDLTDDEAELDGDLTDEGSSE